MCWRAEKSVHSMDIVPQSDNGCTVVDSSTVSKWIQSVVGTALIEAHNIDILFDAVNELAPTTDWVHVMENVDFSSITAGSQQQKSSIPVEYNLMMCIYARACKEPAPFDAVYWPLWKNTEGQNCLMRFIDVCQELQILSAVLNSAPFPIKIKLASAASWKYRSLIENWLIVKSNIYKHHFLEGCVNLLNEIMSSNFREQPQAVMKICWGSFPLFVEVCQSHSGELLPIQLLKEQVRELTLKHLLQPDCFEIIKNHIEMLLNERQFNWNLIVEEQNKVLELKDQPFEDPFVHCRPHLFVANYGHFVLELKTLINSNDENLKDLRKLCHGSPLYHEVDDIFERNKAAAKKAGPIISQYHDYLSRAKIEMLWIDMAVKKIDETNGLLSGFAPVLAELEGFENDISEINRKVSLLSKECTQNFYSQCEALDALAKLWVHIGMLWKKVELLTKDAKDLCLASENKRILVSEKLVYATRFHNIEQLLKKEKESSKLYQELVDLDIEVEQARTSYKKMHMFSQVRDPKKKHKKKHRRRILVVDMAMSWRTRLLLQRNILGEMRDQGRDMCAFVSTVVMRESLGKRENARFRVRDGRWYRPSEPIIKLKLSEHHLQDLVQAFCAKNKRKGRDKLDVCLEQMKETGVVSQTSYNRGDAETMECERYKISDFEQMDASDFDKAFSKLEDAIVLIGTFGITKGYFSLQKGQVYDVPEDAVLETSATGNKLTHAVVIVGYGVTPEGIPYYAFQNSYGPTWMKDGFGMVTCSSIKQLYSAKL